MKTISQAKFTHLLSTMAEENDVPVSGSFELTPLCNLDCKMCYVHRIDAAARGRMLTGEQWIGLIDEAVHNGMMSCVLTGGEAMTHPDFWKIYLHLMDCGVSVGLKTNGLLLNEDTLKRLTEYPPHSIDISLYGCDEDSYEAVTGHRVFNTVLRNIRALQETGIRFRLMVTPSRYMLPRIDDILAFAKTLGVKTVVNALMVESNESVENRMEEYNLTVDEQVEIAKKARALFPPKLMSLSEEEDIYGKRSERVIKIKSGLQCYGGRTSFAICWEGTMAPCLAYPPELVRGYPLTDGFSKAWAAVNAHVKNFVLPEACSDCVTRESCRYCPTTHGRHFALKSVCNPEVCAYYRRLKSELPALKREEEA